MAETVIITGACGDIGRSLAQEFAGAGANLALCDLHSPADAAKVLGDVGQSSQSVLYRKVDVTDASAVDGFTQEVHAALGRIDLCIANAGIVERGALLDLSADAWRRTLDVNLTGSFLTAQAAARSMIQVGGGGHIVMISSWVQDVPRAGIGAYCASKSGMKMLAKCLALELGPHGIRVNLVAPGFVDAGLTGQNLKQNPDLRPGMEGETALGRLISADELARAVRMLCSADAAYVTGTTLLVDGGSSLFVRHPRS